MMDGINAPFHNLEFEIFSVQAGRERKETGFVLIEF